MEVILLEKVRNLGNLGDKVKVRAGYGRNFLVPTGAAIPASEENLAKFEARRAELEQAEAGTRATAQTRAEQIVALGRIVVKHKAGEEGKLFGSVGNSEIATAVNEAGVSLDKHEVDLPDGALRSVGEHILLFQLHTDVTATLTLVIEAE